MKLKQTIALCTAVIAAVSLTACKPEEKPSGKELSSAAVTSSEAGASSKTESESPSRESSSAASVTSSRQTSSRTPSRPQTNTSSQKPKPPVKPVTIEGWDTMVQLEKNHLKVPDQEINGKMTIGFKINGTTVSQSASRTVVLFNRDNTVIERSVTKVGDTTMTICPARNDIDYKIDKGNEEGSWRSMSYTEAINQGLLVNKNPVEDTGIVTDIFYGFGLRNALSADDWDKIFWSCKRTEVNGGYRIDAELTSTAIRFVLEELYPDYGFSDLKAKKNKVTLQLTKDLHIKSIVIDYAGDMTLINGENEAPFSINLKEEHSFIRPHKTVIKGPSDDPLVPGLIF